MKTAIALLLATAFQLQAGVTVGSPAPDFTLTDCSGKSISLSEFRGRPVVLEWINHGCPFVVKHYGAGHMQKLQADAVAKGVVWLSICSSAPGKQGHMDPSTAARNCKDKQSSATAYLLDENGSVGRLYGAKRTPEMYLIGADGTLLYHGAIDDKKSTDPADIPSAKNHIATAIGEVLSGKPVSTPLTEAYGCSIKYAP